MQFGQIWSDLVILVFRASNKLNIFSSRYSFPRFTLTDVPTLLIRFSSDGRWHNKLQTKVDFPISELDTSRYLVGPGSELSRYNLYSVVNHYGSFESGHYTAYCLNQQSWYCYNDNTVSSIDRQELKVEFNRIFYLSLVV